MINKLPITIIVWTLNTVIEFAAMILISFFATFAATAPEAAELHWIKPSRGHFTGHEEVVIKGSKMTSRKCH